jgi:hypothetical protein
MPPAPLGFRAHPFAVLAVLQPEEERERHGNPRLAGDHPPDRAEPRAGLFRLLIPEKYRPSLSAPTGTPSLRADHTMRIWQFCGGRKGGSSGSDILVQKHAIPIIKRLAAGWEDRWPTLKRPLVPRNGSAAVARRRRWRPYSITSSARARGDCGKLRSSAFAAFRLRCHQPGAL